MNTPPPVEPTTDLDPFSLPEWLAEGEVVWKSESGIGASHLLVGELTHEESSLRCDLLAADQAYPAPVVEDDVRARVHRAWRHGEVHLGEHAGQVCVLVPGTSFAPDLVMEALSRLARAVGADPLDWAVVLRVGGR